MNFKTQTQILFLFLLTGFINKSIAKTIPSSVDSSLNAFIEDEIKQFAEDSIKLSVDGKKVFLYGKAKIEYQNTTITANYIEIDWEKNTINASYTYDKEGHKTGIPKLTEGKESFQAENITYNFKTKKCLVKKITTKEGEGYILSKVVKKVTWRDGVRVQVAWLDKFGNTDFVEDCLKGECD